MSIPLVSSIDQFINNRLHEHTSPGVQELSTTRSSFVVERRRQGLIEGDNEHGPTCVSVFSPRGVTPTSEFVCVLPFPDGDVKRHKDLSWFGQEKALCPAGEESLYYSAPKCLYRGEYKCGMK